MEPLLNPSSLYLSASQALGFRSTYLTISKGFESHGADLDLQSTESWQALLFFCSRLVQRWFIMILSLAGVPIPLQLSHSEEV